MSTYHVMYANYYAIQIMNISTMDQNRGTDEARPTVLRNEKTVISK